MPISQNANSSISTAPDLYDAHCVHAISIPVCLHYDPHIIHITAGPTHQVASPCPWSHPIGLSHTCALLKSTGCSPCDFPCWKAIWACAIEERDHNASNLVERQRSLETKKDTYASYDFLNSYYAFIYFISECSNMNWVTLVRTVQRKM